MYATLRQTRMSRAALVVLVATSFAPAARAMPSCTGTYSATSLAPLPTPAVVQYNEGAQSAAITAALDRFVRGLQNAGIVLTGTPTIQMNIAASVLPPANGPNAGMNSDAYTGFGWAANSGPGAPPITGSTLHLTMTLTEIQTSTINWLGDLTCIIQTNNKTQLADELGAVLGRAIGQNFNDKKL
jgi:hypothetical protein